MFILTVVCCGAYPLVVYGIAQLFFSEKANGSLIVDAGGDVRGSKLIGQTFCGNGYFHSRPSCAGNGYDAANSSGSNLGPTSQKLSDAIRERVREYRKENFLSEKELIPADAVMASGSGLDPHISLQNAEKQIHRIAKTRGVDEEKILGLIHHFTIKPDLGFLGEPVVAVLEINLALDSMETKP